MQCGTLFYGWLVYVTFSSTVTNSGKNSLYYKTNLQVLIAELILDLPGSISSQGRFHTVHAV